MVRELGAIIRNQIPSGRGSLLDSYGEILLRAWRECTAASLLAVEDLIQVRSSWISPQLLDQRAGALSCHLRPLRRSYRARSSARIDHAVSSRQPAGL